MKAFLLTILIFLHAAFAQAPVVGAPGEWYSWRNGYELCKDDLVNGHWICREDYVKEKNFCYGKERVWLSQARERLLYDRNEERLWFDRRLVAVRNLSRRCEYHGWARYLQANGTWKWQCYIKNREMEDKACKGFTKR
ncbi:MAG: hypothetical protein LBH25_13645 [Fibromonadaceae bacterium]|nr:hypothetical protein [Fibromonadaceae bacterium]